jgi:hypothetical protein
MKGMRRDRTGSKRQVPRSVSRTPTKRLAPVSKSPIKLPPENVMQRLAKGEKAELTKKEMYELNKRKYKQLPEVKKKDLEKKKREDFKRRQANLKKFNMVSSGVTVRA